MNQKIIVMFENEDVELNISLYDYINELYRHAESFLVCHVCEEDYQKMLKQVSHCCLVERLCSSNIGYDQFNYVMAYDRAHGDIAISDYESNRSKGCYILEDFELKYYNDRVQFPLDKKAYTHNVKIYTTETYNSIIDYYSAKSSKNQAITFSKKEIKRINSAYHKLNSSVNPHDFTEKDLLNFKELFGIINSKLN